MTLLFKGIPIGSGAFALVLGALGIILAIVVVVGVLRAIVSTAWFGASIGSWFCQFSTDAYLAEVPSWFYALTFLLTLATGIGGTIFLIRWVTWWNNSVLLEMLIIIFPLAWTYGMTKFWGQFPLRTNVSPETSRNILIAIILAMVILWVVIILINTKMNSELDLLKQPYEAWYQHHH